MNNFFFLYGFLIISVVLFYIFEENLIGLFSISDKQKLYTKCNASYWIVVFINPKDVFQNESKNMKKYKYKTQSCNDDHSKHVAWHTASPREELNISAWFYYQKYKQQ